MRWGFGLLLTLIACAQVFNYVHSDFIDRLDMYLYDLRIKVQKPQLDKRIVIVDIDEKSLIEVGRFPWSRNILADLVNKLTDQYQVKTVGFDMQFSEPDTSSGYATLESLAKTDFDKLPAFKKKLDELKPKLDYDQLFASSMKNKPIVLGYSFSETQKKGILPAPAFLVSDLKGPCFICKPS